MKLKIGELTLSKFVKGMIGTRLIDPIEVFYIKESNVFYPIVSKSGCSSVKLNLIRLYNPTFTSQFPEIHAIDPSVFTNGNVEKLYFKSLKSYRNFCYGKHMVLIIRNPFERVYSCFLDVKKDKNIMYETPSGLHNFFNINSNYTFDKFLSKIARLPDYLSDRHFRSQTFYLSKRVDKSLNSKRIVLLENIGTVFNVDIKLNVNAKKIPEDILNNLQKNPKFLSRYKDDIKLYNNNKSA